MKMKEYFDQLPDCSFCGKKVYIACQYPVPGQEMVIDLCETCKEKLKGRSVLFCVGCMTFYWLKAKTIQTAKLRAKVVDVCDRCREK
jgi:hypothetical protein